MVDTMGNTYMQEHDEPRSEIDWKLARTMQLSFSALIVFVMVVIWVATGIGEYFWPIWVWFGLMVPIGLQYAIRRASRGPRQWRALNTHASLACLAGVILTFIWALTGFGFWLFWPLFGMVAGLGLHGLSTVWWRALHPAREKELTERVETLTRTRRGALDAQAAELRRIERDLHDGAQARLVAMGLTLDAAARLIDTDTVAARTLLLEARDASGKALAELRDLVRGIHPPVLADRGLDDAIRALALDSPLPVRVTGGLPPRRLPAPVESAGYFAVSELLANVAKHARADSAEIDLRFEDGMLRIAVRDDGRGGAAASGGTGLNGIARRLGAFDGVIAISSPAGGPTMITMEIPCALS
jgi:signal transduction histidine kinase